MNTSGRRSIVCRYKFSTPKYELTPRFSTVSLFTYSNEHTSPKTVCLNRVLHPTIFEVQNTDIMYIHIF